MEKFLLLSFLFINVMKVTGFLWNIGRCSSVISKDNFSGCSVCFKGLIIFVRYSMCFGIA